MTTQRIIAIALLIWGIYFIIRLHRSNHTQANYAREYQQWAEDHRIPECQEDQVLIGQGEFEAGTWDYYICGLSLDDTCYDQEWLKDPETDEWHVDCHQWGPPRADPRLPPGGYEA